MSGRLLTFLFLWMLITAGDGAAAGDDSPWPRFRGPNGSGIAEGQQPPIEVGPRTNVQWNVPVPNGYSSPIVVGDLMVITAFEDERLFTIAYDRADGTEAWRAEAPADEIEPFYPNEGNPAASTPATDGEVIVSYFGSCGLFCYDVDGQEVWRHELPMPALAGNFGTGVSPIISDDLVILVRDSLVDSRIIAVDLDSGDQVWEAPRQSQTSYCTPVVWETSDGPQVVSAGHGGMVAYDLTSGDEVWWVNGLPCECCASPLVSNGILYFAGWSQGGAGDDQFLLPPFDEMLQELDADSSGDLSQAETEGTLPFFDSQDADLDGAFTREEHAMAQKYWSEGKNVAFALQGGIAGNVAESQLLWQQTRGLPYIPTGIVYEGQFVMVKEGGIVTAYDSLTGEQIYVGRVAEPGDYYASPVAANGLIYFTQRDEGVITVLKAGTQTPEVVAENPALGEQVMATPAIADNVLYIRTEGHLYAFAEE